MSCINYDYTQSNECNRDNNNQSDRQYPSNSKLNRFRSSTSPKALPFKKYLFQILTLSPNSPLFLLINISFILLKKIN